MKAEIISIGTEITTGQNLDTHAQWLSRRLAELGIAVGFHTTVGDDLADNLDVFRTALRRADLIVITGGLGPTLDDLTREVMAQVAGVELVEDPASLKFIADLFARRNRPMPERNRVQAMFPRGAEVIPNNYGTAPGIWMTVEGKTFIAMPGVPSEMYKMWEEQVRPRLLHDGRSQGVLIEKKINAFGEGESAIEQRLADVTARGKVPEVGITASDAVISLRILGRGATEAEAMEQIRPVEQIILDRLGSLVFSIGEDELQHVVLRLLDERKLTIASAESLTAGLIAHRLSQVPGASKWLQGGLVTYDIGWKIKHLGVAQSTIDAHGVVSKEVAEEMAVGCREKFGVDLAVSSTGLAGPGTGGDNKPVGTVWVGLAWAGGVTAHTFCWMGTRSEIQSRSAKMALNLVRLHLLKR